MPPRPAPTSTLVALLLLLLLRCIAVGQGGASTLEQKMVAAATSRQAANNAMLAHFEGAWESNILYRSDWQGGPRYQPLPLRGLARARAFVALQLLRAGLL